MHGATLNVEPGPLEPGAPVPLGSGSKKYNVRQLDTGQGIAVYGSGVDTYFIAFHQRFLEWCVTEYHRFTKIIFAIYEFIPNP